MDCSSHCAVHLNDVNNYSTSDRLQQVRLELAHDSWCNVSIVLSYMVQIICIAAY
jgi:hypothetical protein